MLIKREHWMQRNKKNTHSHRYGRSAIIIIGCSLSGFISGSRPPLHPGASQVSAQYKVLKTNPKHLTGQAGGPAKEQQVKVDSHQTGALHKSAASSAGQNQPVKPLCVMAEMPGDQEPDAPPIYSINKPPHLAYELKLYYSLLSKTQLSIQERGDLFRRAQDAYEKLKLVDSQQAQVLWQQFNQYNEQFFKSLLKFYEQRTTKLFTIKLHYNSKLKKDVEDSIETFVFKKNNPWHDFVSCSNGLKSIFTGTTYEHFTQPICKEFAPKYHAKIKIINKKIYLVMSKLDILIQKCVNTIENGQAHELIPTFNALSKQFDDMNEYLMTGLSSYEKKRAEYRALLQKKGPQTATLTKACHEHPHK